MYGRGGGTTFRHTNTILQEILKRLHNFLLAHTLLVCVIMFMRTYHIYIRNNKTYK